MPLRVDVLRHGRAAAAGEAGDASRPLSAEGIEQIRSLGSRLAAEGWRPDRVLTSPLTRARQTAAELLAAAGVALTAETLRELEPEMDPAALEVALRARLEGATHALIVSHQPLVSRLSQRWTGEVVALGTGHLMELEFEGAPGKGLGRLVRSIEN